MTYNETRSRVTVERITLTSGRTFDDVLTSLYEGISRPDIAAAARAWLGATSYEEFEKVIAEAAGPSGLMQFLPLDQGAALAKLPGVPPRRLERIIAGNPLTMARLTRHVPEAGSYAPVSILVWEDGGAVHLAYDTMESSIAPYGSEPAFAVARELDTEVLTLMRAAADPGSDSI
ncbi:hypothetical protein Ade02nite_57780 [Paractinoplanes deccanensis]|uniref:DUF302 domain-containing protein n=1 Tax=Paractinoplanes deccanensis TaxID=113561 RepID=A0ABQ3YAW1_9ACTN|nr:DUF302 domain-containing protein [Actinoplanes deccanensis]GID77137.1 hypothetical protein Ade02nite_57780 [Actinoplanes deccanensis]